ncbi:acyl-CoA dehydrogenase [Nocardioides marmoriginsengisoli]|uniref:Acyl-CoA dehydrogenase n=1 Tax=Nocardioides marmoriginsengisoli TaxID=661483 RepID=A0A3N0CGA7_9ACTN|nr:acyl-CoA dehydrogenase [Nocardioides marmoriginsengisoli]RNL62500.1 acyl-CoA dehydrogenase [Nocardioides marmoriginsengisoli]
MAGSVLQEKLLPTLDYLLYEWLDLGALLERERFRDHDRAGITDLLGTAAEIATARYEPANRVIDDQEPRFDDGRVLLPKETQEAWDAYVDMGFLLATHDEEHGGLQLPRTADFASKIILGAASIGISPAILTEANAALLLTYGTEKQQSVFARRELAGAWTGTMCLSESQAGSSLSDITTRAVPDGAGSEDDVLGPRYRVTGDKMWISAGEHDLAENIVHLVLAKIPGPDGAVDPSTRGISLFVVPKFVVDADGALLERNDVVLVGLNHKLGYRGTPNTALSFGDGSHRPGGERGALGYLVGNPGDGLRQMFHMMNAARIEIGLGAAALGFAGYAASLDYAKQRRQGRPVTRDGKDASRPQAPIVEHADVKRMLLAQKAYAEGGIALGLYAARLLDEQQTGTADEAAEAGRLLEILTPVVKSWPSEWCLEANSLAIQVLGGSGYTRDFPVEQYWRDNRLNMIHEGTHGIQGLDLLGRKVRLEGGAYLDALASRVQRTVARAQQAGLATEADALATAWARAVATAEAAWGTGDPEDALPSATLFLQGFGHVVLAWVWLDIAAGAVAGTHPEAPGKVAAMRFFFGYELPKVGAWLDVVARRETLCRDLDVALL